MGQTENKSFPVWLLVEALSPLVPMLERALRLMLTDPRLLSVSQWEDLPIHATRQASREMLGWVSKHQDIAEWLDPWKAAELKGPEPLLPQRRTIDQLDHPVNRYVSWLVRRVIKKLQSTALTLEEISCQGNNEDSAKWCHLRALQLQLGHQILTVCGVPPSFAVSLVLHPPRPRCLYSSMIRFMPQSMEFAATYSRRCFS
jgi:hypothetical protein